MVRRKGEHDRGKGRERRKDRCCCIFLQGGLCVRIL
jgi:hypothetical protein